jgi:hypothetical protein
MSCHAKSVTLTMGKNNIFTDMLGFNPFFALSGSAWNAKATVLKFVKLLQQHDSFIEKSLPTITD